MRNLITVAAFVLAVIVAFLGAWVLSSNTAEQARQEAVATAVAGALSTQEQQYLRQPPMLLFPPDEATFDNAAEVRLQWNWTRPLETGEVYDVRVWREGEPAYGITWSEENQFDLAKWLLFQEPGEFFWSIAVLKKGENEQPNQEISDAAPPRRFTMSQIKMNILNLLPGFEAELYAPLPILQPTVITFGPDGALYALSVDGPIARLEDTDGDHVAETATVIYDDPEDQLKHAVGLAFYDDKIYVSDSGRISILSDADQNGGLDTITPIVEGLPSLQYTFHSNNGIAFGPDDKLYVAVGSTSDHGPLREHLESSVLRMNPDGSDLEVFATGFRNPFDLAFSPSGDLFTADNSPDELNDTLQYLPPEEVNHVQAGKDYGFPDVFGNLVFGSGTQPPVTELFTSSVSSGLTYYAANQFPPDYQGLYVALFGTGATFPASIGLHNGQIIAFVPLEPDENGSFTGKWKPFARFRTDLSSSYSPIDLTVGPDGALYVAEWSTAMIFRITYIGLPESSVEPLTGDEAGILAQGEAIFKNGVEGAPACATCHLLDPLSIGVGPSLYGLSAVAASRVPGLDAETYVANSITSPNDYTVPGYSAGFMYPLYGEQLTAQQIQALVAYVLHLSPPS